MPLLPMRNRLSNTSCRGSFDTSAAWPSRCSPLATSVTRTTARRAERSAFKVCSTSTFTSGHLFDIDADSPAARQTHFPGRFVGHAEFQHLRFAAVDHVHGLGDDGTFDTAA